MCYYERSTEKNSLDWPHNGLSGISVRQDFEEEANLRKNIPESGVNSDTNPNPRVKGLDALLQAERIQGIINLTLCYQDAEFYAEEGKHEGKAFWQWYDLASFWMQARRPKEISLCIRYHLRESIPSGFEALGGWLRERFAEKDHFLSYFSVGRGKPRLYKRGIDIPMKTKYASLFCIMHLCFGWLCGWEFGLFGEAESEMLHLQCVE